MCVTHTKFADGTADNWRSVNGSWRSEEASVFEEKYVMPLIHSADQIDQMMVHFEAELEVYRSNLAFMEKRINELCQGGW